MSKTCPPEVPNGRSKFPENNNDNADITKDTEPVTEQGESEQVGKSGTVTEIVPPVVEKASSQYTDNTDGNPEIPKEGELVGKLDTEPKLFLQLWTKQVWNLMRILMASQKFLRKVKVN